jgi:probable DNA metabolism protein
VFRVYTAREIPAMIYPETEGQGTLYEIRYIDTDSEFARRVSAALKKLSAELLRFVQEAFLTCLADKELRILEFVMLAFQPSVGAKAMSMLADDRVAVLQKAVLHLVLENQHLQGFLRFAERNRVLTSVIEPKNYVLPLLAPHFADRFPEEDFVIFDKAHGMAAFSEHGRVKYAYADSIEFAEITESEEAFQSMWKKFYKAIAIPERFNPRCRMSMMPKRFWGNMLEVAGELNS